MACEAVKDTHDGGARAVRGRMMAMALDLQYSARYIAPMWGPLKTGRAVPEKMPSAGLARRVATIRLPSISRKFAMRVVCPCLVMGWASAAEFPAADVLLKSELELFGFAVGLTATELPGASGGEAMALSDTARVVGAVRLKAGEYTLLLRTWAPAGDRDGFFIEINGVRTRRVTAIGRWMTMALPCSVAKEGTISLSLIGQESGLIVDLLAVVRGTLTDDQLDVTRLPCPTEPGRRVGMEGAPRLEFPCRLRELRDEAPTVPTRALYRQDFDGVIAGATGTTQIVAGKRGQALYIGVPDGRFDIDAANLRAVGKTGTIEWWVRPRPAQRLWHDQGWHYFLHCQTENAEGPRLDLFRHPLTGLQLTAVCGDKRERLKIDTSRADLEEWHHLLVSWDFSSERQCLWLLFDGKGVGSSFPRRFPAPVFSGVQFGNTPADSGLPWLFMDGALDEIRIGDVAVSERLAR